MNERTPLDAPLEHGRRHAPLVVVTEKETAVLAALVHLDTLVPAGEAWHCIPDIKRVLDAQPGNASPPQGISRTLASLIRKGLARRKAYPRQVYYKITDEGRSR